MKTRTGIVCLMFAASALAGEISGTVFDPSGAVVPNAGVSLAGAEGAMTQKAVAGPAGEYRFTNLAAGSYRVEVSSPGFQLARQTGQLRNTTDTLRLDVLLQLGSVREDLTIRGALSGARAATGARKIRVGGNVQPAKLLVMPRVAFPKDAGAAGRVLLRGVIRIDGTLGGLSVLASPDPALAEAALEAIRSWRYEPTRLNGQPVETTTLITLDFQSES